MTDQELKDLVASISISQKNTEAMISQVSENIDKTDAMVSKLSIHSDKTDIMVAELSINSKKTEEHIKAVSRNIDGVNKSIGLDTEEFFYSSLGKNLKLGDVKFDFIEQNRRRRKDGNELEIDIFMENGNSVGIVEVKNKVSKKHIEKLENDMKKFNTFFPSFKNYKKYGAMAGKVITPEIESILLKKGFFVLKQQGTHMEIVPPL